MCLGLGHHFWKKHISVPAFFSQITRQRSKNGQYATSCHFPYIGATNHLAQIHELKLLVLHFYISLPIGTTGYVPVWLSVCSINTSVKHCLLHQYYWYKHLVKRGKSVSIFEHARCSNVWTTSMGHEVMFIIIDVYSGAANPEENEKVKCGKQFGAPRLFIRTSPI